MKNPNSPREEFKQQLYESFKVMGIDDFPSKLMSLLESEPKEISLGELAETTGYSLSALSTALKAMEENHLVKRFKKPGSRKVYVFMDKDLVSLYTELQKKRYEKSLMPALRKIRGIIKKYKDQDEFQDEIELLEDFYQQLLFLEVESRKYIEALEKWRDKENP